MQCNLKEEPENQHFCYQVVYPSSPVVELFLYLKHQSFCNSKVNVDKVGLYNIKVKSTMHDLMVTV